MRPALTLVSRFSCVLILALSACETSIPGPPARDARPSTPAAPAEPQPPAGPNEKNPAPSGLAEVAGIHYLEFVTGGAQAEDRLPMIVAIHGLGDSPEGFAGVLRSFDRPARVIVPRALDRYGRGWSWFPIRVAESSDEELATGIHAAAEQLAPAIDQLARERPTTGRPIVTGFSQGGMLSFALAVEHSESIAAALPVGGALPKPLWPEPTTTVAPILAFHGEADDRVPFAPTQAAVEALTAAGFDASLRSYPGVGHTISRPMHADLFAALRERLP